MYVLVNVIFQNKEARAVIDVDFAMKLSTAKSNSFSVVADFFAKGIFADTKSAGEMQKKNVEKVKGTASIYSVMGKNV